MVGFGGISVGNDDDDHHNSSGHRWKGRKGVRGASWAKMPLLTIGLLGCQMVWSTEMGYASPYLLSLGLSKSLMSIVFVAGPLSGLFVQPLIGALADHSTSPWGRRRPYMISGSVLCAIAVLLLGFTKDVSSWFLPRDSDANATLTLWLAVFAIYCIDFSINAVQAADRALLVDTLPTSQQERGNAWAGRMLSVGSVVGFWVGNLHLAKLFPMFGKTQLQVLCTVSALLLLGTHAITSFMVKERVLLPDDDGPDSRYRASKHKKKTGLRGLLAGTIGVFKEIWDNTHTLPPNIRQICLVQFFSWIGWFPVLFFSTVWVGEIYTLSLPPEAFADATENEDGTSSITEEATLRGFRALLYSALLGLATIIILPLIVAASKKAATRRGRSGSGGINLAELWCFSLFLFALCMFATLFTSTSVKGATLVVATTGFCFAVSQWIPFSLLAEEIRRGSDDGTGTPTGNNGDNGYQPVGNGDDARDPESIPLHGTPLVHHSRDDEDRPETAGLVFDAGEPDTAQSRTHRTDVDERTLVDSEERRQQGRHNANDRTRRAEERELMKDLEATEFGMESPFVNSGPGGSGRGRFGLGDDMELQLGGYAGAKENIGDKAGIILGIHNVAIVIPQFLVTGLSAIVFAFFSSGVSGVHPGAGHAGAGVGPGNVNITGSGIGGLGEDVDGGAELDPVEALVKLVRRAKEGMGEAGDGDSNPNGIGFIFRIGGVCSFIAFLLCWKLARDLRRR